MINVDYGSTLSGFAALLLTGLCRSCVALPKGAARLLPAGFSVVLLSSRERQRCPWEFLSFCVVEVTVPILSLLPFTKLRVFRF